MNTALQAGGSGFEVFHGSAYLAVLGAGCRRFKSSRPDQLVSLVLISILDLVVLSLTSSPKPHSVILSLSTQSNELAIRPDLTNCQKPEERAAVRNCQD